MSLTALQWRMLPEYFMPISGTVNTVSQSILNDRISILNGIYNSFTSSIYHDGSSRITGSTTGSNGWTFFKSGSNLEKNGGTNVVYGYPPTITVMSQSIIFAAGPTGSISPTSIKLMNSYGMFSTLGYDIQPTSSFSSNNTASIYVGVSKNSGIYKYFANTNPMETGSNVTAPSSSFSGYLRTNTPAKIYKMRIWECKEAIALQFYDAFSGESTSLVAGALIDPESPALGETDGRIYGITTTNGLFTAPLFLSFSDNVTYSRLFENSTGELTGKFLYFQPKTTSMLGTQQVSNTILSSSFVTDGNFMPRLPMYLKDMNSGRWVGRAREIQMIKNTVTGTIFKTGTTLLGYSLAGNERNSNNSVFLVA